jgi:hypothetical protein
MTLRSNKICIICYELINDDYVITDCNHEFCDTCIDKWIKIKPTCPYCDKQFNVTEGGIHLVRIRKSSINELREILSSFLI